MDALFGLLGAAVGAAIFVCGYLFGKNTGNKKETEQYTASEEEMKEIREERERLIREQEAFKELMSYNTNMAYGVTANPLK